VAQGRVPPPGVVETFYALKEARRPYRLAGRPRGPVKQLRLQRGDNDSAKGVVVGRLRVPSRFTFKKLVQVLDSAALTGGSSLVIIAHKLLKQYRQEDGWCTERWRGSLPLDRPLQGDHPCR